ncbi:hypothetical protein GUY40_07425 [Pseudomonas sp. R5(2019)]|nr:amino acid synthesis family protein [Pseudomonas sp. R5(2019)]NBA94800.1 hypothetical protein [Pseudomonas sp. R5(2019)]
MAVRAPVTKPVRSVVDQCRRRCYFYPAIEPLGDTPRADEIVVVLGAADGGRVHSHIGNRYLDTLEMEAQGL